MIPVCLSLNKKNVLIVGGGKVALRKVNQFLKEGANVVVLSTAFLPEFNELPITCIKNSYNENYLDNMFLVYSAVNKDINKKVVADCHRKNILCGSSTIEKTSFYSMTYKETDAGLIAYSSYQRLPYNTPIIKELCLLLDKQKERIDLLSQLRPYIIKHIDNRKEYFDKLYHCPIEVLSFLLESLKVNRGLIITYHPSLEKFHLNLNTKPYILLSFTEFYEYKELFVFPINYTVFPLLLSKGKHYQKVVDKIPTHWNNIGPLIRNDQDIKDIVNVLQNDKYLLFIIHPTQDNVLENKFRSIGKVKTYSFNQEFVFDKDYEIVILLITKSKHYNDLSKKLCKYNVKGKMLLEFPQMISYIENRIGDTVL